MTEATALTNDQQATIDQWHERIQRRLYPQMTNPAWIYLRFRGGDRGLLTELWVEMICRLAIHNGGRALLDTAVQALVEKALSIPIMLFYEKIHVSSWAAYESPITNWLGNTWFDVDFTMASSALALAAGQWPPVLIPHTTVPDFGTVTPEEVYPWLGFTGGVLDTEAHDPLPVTIKVEDITLTAGTAMTVAIEVTGGVPPYVVTLVSENTWIILNTPKTGVMLAPTPSQDTGKYTATVIATDRKGTTAEAILTVTVE